jgi:hypothetical protein
MLFQDLRNQLCIFVIAIAGKQSQILDFHSDRVNYIFIKCMRKLHTHLALEINNLTIINN